MQRSGNVYQFEASSITRAAPLASSFPQASDGERPRALPLTRTPKPTRAQRAASDTLRASGTPSSLGGTRVHAWGGASALLGHPRILQPGHAPAFGLWEEKGNLVLKL